MEWGAKAEGAMKAERAMMLDDLKKTRGPAASSLFGH